MKHWKREGQQVKFLRMSLLQAMVLVGEKNDQWRNVYPGDVDDCTSNAGGC
jgi:hypothetical protein